MSSLDRLPAMYRFYGACDEAVEWLESKLKSQPNITVREIWAAMLQLPHRTGIAWGAWVRAGGRCTEEGSLSSFAQVQVVFSY